MPPVNPTNEKPGQLLQKIHFSETAKNLVEYLTEDPELKKAVETATRKLHEDIFKQKWDLWYIVGEKQHPISHIRKGLNRFATEPPTDLAPQKN